MRVKRSAQMGAVSMYGFSSLVTSTSRESTPVQICLASNCKIKRRSSTILQSAGCGPYNTRCMITTRMSRNLCPIPRVHMHIAGRSVRPSPPRRALLRAEVRTLAHRAREVDADARLGARAHALLVHRRGPARVAVAAARAARARGARAVLRGQQRPVLRRVSDRAQANERGGAREQRRT
jgi:hypothetical protein